MTDGAEWPKRVRIAQEPDEAGLFDLLMALHKDKAFGIPPRPQDIRQAIRAGTRERQGTIIGVIDGERGEIAASVCVVPFHWWYNSDAWALMERWLFVVPKYRKHDALYDELFQFMRCYRDMTDEATHQHWPLITNVNSLRRLPAMMRLWRRYGELIGGIYVVGGWDTGADARNGEAA